jgi:transporter family protein
MNKMIPLWAIFALLSAVTAALVAIFAKIGLQNVNTTVATTARALIMFVFLFLVVIFSSKLSEAWTFGSKAWFYIILSGIAGAVSWLFYFLALKFGEASKVAPIDRLSVVFVLIFAVMFLGEKLTWKVGIGAGLVAAGAILMIL